MPDGARVETVRRAGAGVAAVAGVWTAATLVGGGTWATVGNGFRALLGEGAPSDAVEALWALRGDALPLLVLVLGLVPAVALLLDGVARRSPAAGPDTASVASRVDGSWSVAPGARRPTSRGAGVVVGVVAAGAVAVVAGLLVVSADPASVRLPSRPWIWLLVSSPRTLAGVWLTCVGAGLGAAGIGVLLRRRGPVVGGALAVAVGASATALSAAAWTARTVVSVARYRGGPSSLAVVLQDGVVAAGLVATTAAVVAGSCAVVAWRRLEGGEPSVRTAAPEERRAIERRRRLIALGVSAVVVVVVGTASSVRVAEQRVVDEVVADPVLAACLERALGAGRGDGLAPRGFDDVFAVDCPRRSGGAQIRSLDGVERLTSVREVDLTGQDVADLRPLAALTRLTSLRLTNNPRVADLTPLAGLPLDNLGLSGTGVRDLGPLAGTTSLRFVGLGGTGVSDLSPLAGSSGLIELDVSDAAVVDLSPLAGAAQLTKIDARDNQVVNLAPLAGMPALDELWIGGNPVADLRPLVDAPALLGVDVEGLPGTTPGIEELRARGVYVGGLA
ncbi:hypothetical protein OMK64_10190 [Cellulomonas fimi]|uniref:leucine-rich repeat domain-containing protein n=1 Tax=Cellulomonas fimi TaxID=1708 RepID=UPI00234CB932|nr:leucine-rich repeat domain-containing protein [Cellulomonas fimi]MDC7121904.1 hypothetical protein [Cellulomonas fimi]